MFVMFAPPSAVRLSRLVQTVAVDVEQPAVIDAPQPTVFNATVAEVRAPVRAIKTEETHASFVVAEQDKVFAHDPHRAWRSSDWKLAREDNGLPVATQ
jgi:hypothetical protein